MNLKGIDVSKWQGNIDWKKVKNDGVQFAMLRLGYGLRNKDSSFERNVRECEKYGIKWGAYFYSYALNVNHARIEAEYVLKQLEGKKPSFPIAFDMEDADYYKRDKGMPSNKVLVDICSTFLTIVESKGYYVMLYANLDWLKNKLNDSKLDRFDKWLAQWSKKPTYNKKFTMWQYTSSGKVNGITGSVDMNIGYSDYVVGSKPKEVEVVQKENSYHVIRKGETLSGIAKKYKSTVNRLMELNPQIKNKNVIIIGEKVYLDDDSPNEVIYHEVKKGETLGGIAKKYNTSVRMLMLNNPKIKNANKIYVNDVLVVRK